jgi:hypothetical protein
MKLSDTCRLAGNLILAGFLICTAAYGSECGLAVDNNQSASKHFCDILSSPALYDGEKVVVEATYRSSFEETELYCLSCSKARGVWVAFEASDRGKKSASTVERLLRKKLGTVNGTFEGVFHSNGHYGSLGLWSFEITIDSVRNLKLIDREGRPPVTLSAESRSRVCQ